MKPIFVFVCFVSLLPSVEMTSDYSTLVYKNCGSGWFSDSITAFHHSEAVRSFFEQITASSSRSKFLRTTAGDDDAGVSGLFQCRGDLSNSDCYDCVNRLSQTSNALCGKAVSARVQLHGCYFLYDADEFRDADDDHEMRDHELMHKACGEEKAAAVPGFEQMREAAFAAMESGMESGKRFYSEYYELVQVMAECEGDLGGCDCRECVSSAVAIVEEECSGSVSGQVYLDKCFVSYAYNPHGIPDEKGNGNNKSNAGKLVAIVLGGGAALGLGFIFLSLFKKLGKKDDDC